MISFADSPTSQARLILASGSPRRFEILAEAGLQPVVIKPSVDEFPGGTFPPRELSVTNARLKALAVSVNYPNDFVLGSDTVVSLAGRVFGKPATLAEAAENLRAFRGGVHEVLTGVVIRYQEIVSEFVEVSYVKFRDYDDELIARYLAAVPVLDKAGGYAIQDHGEWLVEKIEGDYHNIVGLPLTKVLAHLTDMGFVVPESS